MFVIGGCDWFADDFEKQQQQQQQIGVPQNACCPPPPLPLVRTSSVINQPPEPLVPVGASQTGGGGHLLIHPSSPCGPTFLLSFRTRLGTSRGCRWSTATLKDSATTPLSNSGCGRDPWPRRRSSLCFRWTLHSYVSGAPRAADPPKTSAILYTCLFYLCGFYWLLLGG